MAFFKEILFVPDEGEVELGTEDDKKVLEDMGIQQDLFRGVSSWFMNFAFTFTEVSFLTSYSILFTSGLIIGGPAVMSWGWIVGSFFNVLAGFAMAEICSVYPSAGSVYHWAGQLASEESAPVWSYVTGWLNLLGNACGDASFASGFGAFVAGAVGVATGDNLSDGAIVGISILGLTLWSVMNVSRVDTCGILNNFAAIYQIVLTLVIIICCLVAAGHNGSSGSFVFTRYENQTGLDNNDGYVVLLGLLTTLFTFSGYEAGGHMAEETQNARKSAPRGIAGTVVAVAVVGFVYVIGLLFAIPNNDLDAVVNGYFSPAFNASDNCTDPDFIANYPDNCTLPSGSDNALVNLFVLTIGNNGAIALSALLVVNIFLAGNSSVTITSRITFALARDKALPFSDVFYTLNEKTKSPFNAIMLIWFLDVILLLIGLGNSTAFVAITSLTTIGFQLSYAMPIIMRITYARKTFQQSAFSLGVLSYPIHVISAIWLVATSLLFFWPSQFPVDGENMNYAVVVVGCCVLIAVVYWFVHARKVFKGPVRVAGSNVN